MAFRLDIGTLRPAKRLDDGRLIAEGCLTRTGVFEYRNPDGSLRREWRPAEEVFKQDSLQTFALVPVTDDHPPEMLTAKTAKQYAVGAVGETVRKDGNHVVATLSIFDESTVAKMDAGKVQLSCGYAVDLIEMPGITPDGEHYDAIQTNIRGNHVALVERARAGESARVRMDAAAMVAETQPVKEVHPMEELLKNALENAIAEKARADKAEDACKAEKARADKAEAELAQAEAACKAEKDRADKAEAARTDSDEKRADEVRARVKLEKEASEILKDTDVAKLDDKQIKLEVVKAVDGDELDASRSDGYIDGRYEAALKRSQEADKSRSDARQAAAAPATPKSTSESDAFQKLRNDYANAYKAV